VAPAAGGVAVGEGAVVEAVGQAVLGNNGRVLGGAEPEARGTSFTLLDDKGRPFPVVKSENEQARPGSPREHRLTFAAGAGQGEPARLVYTGPLSTVLDVPFTLKDVPLP
jgi:hypothetical protein